MGSSFALALKKARPDTVIVGSDANPLVVRKALEREIVSTANTDLSVVTMADVIVVAAPRLAGGGEAGGRRLSRHEPARGGGPGPVRRCGAHEPGEPARAAGRDQQGAGPAVPAP